MLVAIGYIIVVHYWGHYWVCYFPDGAVRKKPVDYSEINEDAKNDLTSFTVTEAMGLIAKSQENQKVKGSLIFYDWTSEVEVYVPLVPAVESDFEGEWPPGFWLYRRSLLYSQWKRNQYFTSNFISKN